MAKTEVSKMTVSIPDVDVDKLAKMADRHRSTKTSALVRAIRTASYLEEATAKGEKIIIRDEEGNDREVVFQ